VNTLDQEIRSLIHRSEVPEGMVYLQLTRGEAPRSHPFPEKARPTLFFYVRDLPPAWRPGEGEGCKLISVKDERWSRCHIKSIALLPNVLAKNHAIATGHDEAVFIADGKVTECSASNIFCVRSGRITTCAVGAKVLPGITRMVVQRIASRLGIAFDEVSLPLEDALKSDEVLITSTTRELNWVKAWDGKTIGSGECGPVTQRLHEAYLVEVEKQIAAPARPPVIERKAAGQKQTA